MGDKLYTGSEWNFNTIQRIHEACEQIAVDELHLDFYPNQIEIVSSEQMIDSYASIGMPIMYNHWSFGKTFMETFQGYSKGRTSLAYELVINSNPCISYLMEDNTATLQALVIAHAAFGHNAFFKSNYLFREWTDADGIVDYLLFAKNYISQCEEKYGIDEVEKIVDAAHSLMNVGVDRYKKPKKLSIAKERDKQRERDEYTQKTINDLWRTLPQKEKNDSDESKLIDKRKKDLGLPEENFLFFLEKKSPILEGWQREILRIVRKISQYFYPQKQSKIMNEGFATFVHYYIMTRLHEKGLIDDGSFLEFIHSHSGVMTQRDFDDRGFYGFNPYSLGYAMYDDIKRICMDPTSEDKEWFPDFAGNGKWLETITYAMKNFRDESFISQYLSPKVIRDFKIFAIEDVSSSFTYKVLDIHNEQGYKNIRKRMSSAYNISNIDPDIQIYDADLKGDRELFLKYNMYNGIPLSKKSTLKILKYIKQLWGYPIKVLTQDMDSGTQSQTHVM